MWRHLQTYRSHFTFRDQIYFKWRSVKCLHVEKLNRFKKIERFTNENNFFLIPQNDLAFWSLEWIENCRNPRSIFLPGARNQYLCWWWATQFAQRGFPKSSFHIKHQNWFEVQFGFLIEPGKKNDCGFCLTVAAAYTDHFGSTESTITEWLH